MSIVRSLLINIGFVTDKKAINETNRAITGFKTRFAIAATAATYAFKVIKDFFSDIATAILDSDELARTLGISLNEFTALQQAAEKFRIKPEQFAGIFSTLNKDLEEFRQGFGKIPEIARQLGIEISKDDGPRELFDKYIQAIRGIENEQDRIRIANNIFGQQLGAKISDLAIGYEDFKSAVSEAYKQLESQPNILPQAKAYEDAVRGLSESWNKFALSLSQTVFPVFRTLINFMTVISDLARDAFNFNAEGVKSALNSASGLLDPIFEATGLNKISDVFKGLYGGKSLLNTVDSNSFQNAKDYAENRLGYGFSGSNTNMSPITNNIEISVPPGTTADQSEYMSNVIKNAIEDSIMSTFYQIQNNNPQVE